MVSKSTEWHEPEHPAWADWLASWKCRDNPQTYWEDYKAGWEAREPEIEELRRLLQMVDKWHNDRWT